MFVVVPGGVHLTVVLVSDCPIGFEHEVLHFLRSQVQQSFGGNPVSDFWGQLREGTEQFLWWGLCEHWGDECFDNFRDEREVDQIRIDIEY